MKGRQSAELIPHLIVHIPMTEPGPQDRTSDLAKRTEAKLAQFGLHRAMIEAISQDYEIPIARIFSAQRDATTAIARQIMMAMLYWHTNETLIQVGKWFNRDHSTVIYARERIQHDMATNERMKAYIEHLEQTFIGIDHAAREPDRQRLDKRAWGGKAPGRWEP